MSKELREAAEKIVAYKGTLGEERLSVLHGPQFARAYLAEHPLDDQEPVTEEWLRSIGKKPWRYDVSGFAIDDRCLSIDWEDGEWRAWIWDVEGFVFLRIVATRGDVRFLCRALGIELEKAHAEERQTRLHDAIRALANPQQEEKK